MKIAQIAPLAERVPPKYYGGTERVVHALTEELVKRGHEVTLFASGDSLTSAKLVGCCSKSLREANLKDIYGTNIWTLLNIGEAYKQQSQFDIIHDHTGFISLPTAHMASTPTLMTMHSPFDSENLRLFQKFKRPCIVTLSRSQASTASGFNHFGTVHNGLFMDNYPFSRKHDNYLLFVGRICFEKGLHLAIKAARSLNFPLIIAAKLEEKDLSYFEKYVKPWLNKNIQWIGEVSQQKRNELFSRAMAFLHPITWQEPFGLTLIEAMACGCPVIAFDKGSIPEIIKDGETGFIVSNLQGMCEAIKKIHCIDRDACRTYSLKSFNAQKMTDRYEVLYRKCIEFSKNSS